MARKRKTEVKPTVKSAVKYVPVRKSSRQIAKKQLEEKKINGDISQTSCSNSPEDSRDNLEDQTRAFSKKNQNSVRKHSRHKNNPNNKVTVISNDDSPQCKNDSGDSDSQDGLADAINYTEKLSPQDVQQVVIGNPSNESMTPPTSLTVDVWQEEVIEETIVCEQMEVDEDITSKSYSLKQESNISIKEEILIDESTTQEEKIADLTVIKDECITEAMVVECNSETSFSSEQCIIEKTVVNMEVDKSGNILSDLPTTSTRRSDGNSSSNVGRSYASRRRTPNDQKRLQVNSDQQSVKRETRRRRFLKQTEICEVKDDSCSSSDSAKEDCKKQDGKIAQSTRDINVELPKDDAVTKLDDNMAEMQISDSSKEIQKLVNDLSNMETADSPIRTPVSMEKILPMSMDDESSSSILEKMEQLHHSSNSAVSEATKSFKGTIEHNDLSRSTEENDLPSVVHDNNTDSMEIFEKSNTTQDHANIGSSRKTDSPQISNDANQSIEVDNKVDSDDLKLSSGSDNSNDTLLTVNESKCNNTQANDIDKKTELKSTSGGTSDATSSENDSNSSGVRRSSRIRSIGLMKQRSRGRGLVTKPSADVLKSGLQQEREKVIIAPNSTSQEIKADNPPESQSDKENSVNKGTSSLDSLPPVVNNCSTTGYESDSSKPVKVKSRWRRSSELEMGGSNIGFGSTVSPSTTFGGIVLSSIPESGSNLGAKLISTGFAGETALSESPTGSLINVTNTQSLTEAEQSKEISTTTNNSVSNAVIAHIPKTIGAKISLPMVESKDREMEERLSQFEYLQENLYLTERYTNKETKRMVCDCFLTEEEIERGELGCGEDCLNRLLMIECGPRCVVGDRCTNRRFQNCEYAKCEVFRTEKKGFGLRATIDLLAGEFIMEYVGEVVDPKDFRRRAKEYSKDKNRHYYFMALKSDQIIDATMKGNVSRFINHSCDPNAETQKWTVNGELRIGFFNKKFIAAGEEITFDYHFQRYGKEAQKCFCEAPNCRGWIGETPEEEKEKIEKKEKQEKDVKKKKEEKKPADYMEDEDLEEEIEKLCSGGLKNRAHTLTLSRLMVRSREIEHRTRLLRLIQSGEQPCRRLFLDYHGLRLIWSYVMDISTDDSDEAQHFRLEVLKTLNTLPIPNKTMLMDSKIYGVVEKWSKRLYISSNGDSPEDDQGKTKLSAEESQSSYDSNEKKSPIETSNIDKSESNNESPMAISDIKLENGDPSTIPDLAASLLGEWSHLKEVFRIPKKERIEQMKEHEREADRGYREELEKDEKRVSSYDRPRIDRFGRQLTETDKRTDRRRGRESPESEHTRTKDKRVEERSTLVPIPRMTKYERRQLFALKVAKEDEERQRRQQQESWQDHENRCIALGIDPHTTAMLDPQTGYPVFYNPSLGQWQHYSTPEGEMGQQCTPVYVGGPQAVTGHSQTGIVSQSPHVLQSQMSTEISPNITPAMPTGVPPVVYTMAQTPVFNQTTTAYSLLSHRHQQYSDSQLSLSNSIMSVHANPSSVPIQQPVYNHVEKTGEQQLPANDASASRTSQQEPPPIDLPPKWKSAIDARGRIYYYHVKERISQWLPPPPDHIGVQPDSSSSSESSEESSSSNEEEEDNEEEHTEEQKVENVDVSCAVVEGSLNGVKQITAKKPTAHNTPPVPMPFPETKKRRDGLVQERIISPRREEDRVDHKSYKGIKEKLRRQKERAKQKEHAEKLRKHRRSSKSKSHSRHSIAKLQSASTEGSTMSERKIKDTFRINMANVMVHFLNPYRKNDCKQGRITNTEDFKHLARKLTHFVLAKELKHCKSVDELQCNENVKHKAKDFVRKYMSKFGAVYQKSTDDD